MKERERERERGEGKAVSIFCLSGKSFLRRSDRIVAKRLRAEREEAKEDA